MITSLYWERFYIRPARYREYRDIDHSYIHRYTGLLRRGSTVYLNCINRGALELTKTIMCKPQVKNGDYHP